MSFWPRNWRRGGEEAADLVGAAGDHVLEGGLGLPAPVPGVLEGGDLGGGFLAGALAEEDVVGGVGVEGRVQVDEVDGLVGDVLAEDVQVVAEVEAVGGFGGGRGGGGHGGRVPWARWVRLVVVRPCYTNGGGGLSTAVTVRGNWVCDGDWHGWAGLEAQIKPEGAPAITGTSPRRMRMSRSLASSLRRGNVRIRIDKISGLTGLGAIR